MVYQWATHATVAPHQSWKTWIAVPVMCDAVLEYPSEPCIHFTPVHFSSAEMFTPVAARGRVNYPSNKMSGKITLSLLLSTDELFQKVRGDNATPTMNADL